MAFRAYLLHTLLAWTLAAGVHATEARVVSIQDGDTITVLNKDWQVRVRIAGIDAPEKGQVFGAAAKESLVQLTAGQLVDIRCHKHDRYGRDVCSVFIGTRDVGLEQVRLGYAWWYRDYAREQSSTDRASYAAAESRARDARRGLWREQHPTPPWIWRKKSRAKVQPA